MNTSQPAASAKPEDDRRCFLRVRRRGRRGRDEDTPEEDGRDAPPPETVAVPVTGDDGKARVMLFDLIRKRQQQQQQPGHAGGIPTREDAVEAALARMTLAGSTASRDHRRRQPLPRSEAQCRAVRTTRDGSTIFIDVSATLGERFKQDTDATEKRGRGDVAEDEDIAWAVYEARGNLAALRCGPAPRLDDEGDRRDAAARGRHRRLLEDFTQEIDPDNIEGAAWQVLDVPLDQPWTIIETPEEVQRLVYDPAEGAMAPWEQDEDGALGAYRRMRRFIASQAVVGDDGVARQQLGSQSAPTIAAYAGDDLDSNAEDASGNEYPSTVDEEEVARDSADDDDEMMSSDGAGSDFQAPATNWTNRRNLDVVIDERDEDDDGCRGGAPPDDGDGGELSDSWGVGTPKAKRRVPGRILGMDDDSDDEAGGRRYHDAFSNHYDAPYADAGDVYVTHGRDPADVKTEHEAYAPDDVYFDNEGNAYW